MHSSKGGDEEYRERALKKNKKNIEALKKKIKYGAGIDLVHDRR